MDFHVATWPLAARALVPLLLLAAHFPSSRSEPHKTVVVFFLHALPAVAFLRTRPNAQKYDGPDEVVRTHRDHLRAGFARIDDRWVERNLGRTLAYLHFLGGREGEAAKTHIDYHRKHGKTPPNYLKAKQFTLLPTRRYALHSVPIEANGLYRMCQLAGIITTSTKATDFTDDQVMWFNRCFDFERFAKLGRFHTNCFVHQPHHKSTMLDKGSQQQATFAAFPLPMVFVPPATHPALRRIQAACVEPVTPSETTIAAVRDMSRKRPHVYRKSSRAK